MKKVLSVLFAVALVFGMGTPAFASEDEDIKKAIELIEKTNLEIDQKIEKAVIEADKLQANYIYEVRKIEEGDKIIKLEEEKGKVLSNLGAAKNDLRKQADLNEKLFEINNKIADEKAKINSKMAEINQEIADVTAQLVVREDKETKKLEEKIHKLENKLNEKSEKCQEKTKKYTEDLEEVITRIYNETLKMSAETIKKAADKGVQAECSWKLVRFADKWVWIDPIRVVKF